LESSYRNSVLRWCTSLGQVLRNLDDDGLRLRARGLRDHAHRGGDPESLVVDCFAVVREVAHRTIGLRPYDEQLAAGFALSSGAVIEMQTGEGKTLAAVAPVALALNGVLLVALFGRGPYGGGGTSMPNNATGGSRGQTR